jgi:pimeloyl-ACP methyl ester carboxylesterase
MRQIVFLLAVIASFMPTLCSAAESRISVPLWGNLLLPQAAADWLPSVNDWVVVRGMNEAFGDGFQVHLTDQNILIRFDTDKLPADWNNWCDTIGRFTVVAAPDAVARQNQRFGLHLPEAVDPRKPLVILVHGLDGDRTCCEDLARLLNRDGFQTAFFAYPAERPLSESSELFARHMELLHAHFPSMRIDLVTESMGGLIARKYVEGSGYTGGVDHFILIAPPNSGSSWTPLSLLLKLGVNGWKWEHDPDWSAAWMVTEGICQAADDLRPESKFLAELNSRPRRNGVQYTIIAGERPVQYRLAAETLDWCGNLMNERVAGWWGFRQMKSATDIASRQLRGRIGTDDGPVSLPSAELAGVSDFQVIPADHVSLYESIDGQPPAAWPVVRDRLGK